MSNFSDIGPVFLWLEGCHVPIEVVLVDVILVRSVCRTWEMIAVPQGGDGFPFSCLGGAAAAYSDLWISGVCSGVIVLVAVSVREGKHFATWGSLRGLGGCKL